MVMVHQRVDELTDMLIDKSSRGLGVRVASPQGLVVARQTPERREPLVR